MGLNISVYRFSEDRDKEGYLVQLPTTFKWDTIRHIGDSVFAQQKEVLESRIPDNEHRPEEYYHRPIDFNYCRTFVMNNIPEGNRARLLDILDIMECDKNIWFYFSY